MKLKTIKRNIIQYTLTVIMVFHYSINVIPDNEVELFPKIIGAIILYSFFSTYTYWIYWHIKHE